ncbi:MAG: alpha/beta fold hydrolase [Candidatus Dormibacteria bacterium]
MEGIGSRGTMAGRPLRGARTVRPQDDGGPAPIVRYAGTSWGPQLAWAMSGHGSPPLLAVSGLTTHLNLDWTEREIGEFWRELARRRRLIRYDRPGVGMADRFGADFSLEGELECLSTVLAASGESRVALFGRNMSGFVAMAFAALHPDRVSHLILFGTSAPFLASDDFPHGVDPALADAVERLVRAEWGIGSAAICQMIIPGAPPDAVRWHTEYQRSAATGQVVGDMIRSHVGADVSGLLGQIRVPTLVLHRREDRAVSLLAARHTAEHIPGARLHVLEGAENLSFYGDSRAVIDTINGFLDPATARLTLRETEVLSLAAEGLGNREIGERLSVSDQTVARHMSNVFLKLSVGNRRAAVAHARRAGLLD